ncbi:hypothetical protein DQX05_07685 [Paenibacillus thiaminolyticus]|uniref:Uncharacterized protein n=1 Tax=Paenibacillus thiaminolyticus TaxID=49283 RepID=A0A3A3GQ15_PANTH|nr:hypothetical protein DQX05_07685 [Paenibacillus thiaminolyticus]
MGFDTGKRTITEQDIPFLWIPVYESLYVPDGKEPFNPGIIREPSISKYGDFIALGSKSINHTKEKATASWH